MALSYQNYTGDSVTDTFAIPFTYTDTSEISVTVDGVAETGLTFPSTSSVQLTSAPATSTLVQVRRNTDLTARAVDYVSGSVLTEEDLDNANIQVFHAAQEAVDKASDGITLDNDDKWDAQSKIIKNVADPVANTDAVNKQFLGTNLPNITTVAGIAADVSTVAGISSDVTAVAADATDIGTVSTNIASVNTVATNIADVITVANDLNEAISEIETAADDLNEAVSDIDTVSTNIANVNAVGGSITNVNTVATNIANVNTVAGNNANVTTVAGISGDVTTVASNNANVTAVAGNATNINTVAANNANVTTVAGISANVTTVANDTVDIGTVASNIADVNTVAANNSNITAVAADATDIGTVASNIANVNAVGGDITNVNTVAANLTDVNAFADTYFISATAPTSPTQGDLWFDTDPASLVMKVYDGSGWVNAGSSVNGTSERQTYTATGGQTTFAATYDAGYVDVYLNGVKLIDGSDFTATNGTSIVLSTGATAGDTVDIVAYGTFTLLSTVLDDLSDVSTAGATSGQVLSYNGASWAASTPSVPTLSSLGIANHDNLTVDASGNVTVSGTFTSQGIDDNATSTAMTLDSGGNLLVGTTNESTWQTTAGHVIRGNSSITATRDGGQPLIVNRLTSDGTIIDLRKDGTTVGSISSRAGLVSTLILDPRSGIGAGLTGAGGASFGAIAPTDETGTETNDHVDIGKAAYKFRNLYLSGGVYLGGTGSSNLLDDYEEGTWTPVVTAGSGSFTSTSGSGRYTKIGNTVHCWGYSRITNVSGGTNIGGFSGLPFAGINDSFPAGNRSGIGIVREDQRTGILAQMFIQGGQPYGVIQSVSGGNMLTPSTNDTFLFEVTYKTSA